MSDFYLFIQTKLNHFAIRTLIATVLLVFFTTSALMAIPLKTYAAADPSSAQIKELLGLRVKVEYETEPDEENAEQSVKAAEQLRDVLSDDWLDIDPEEWEKSGNYYYYQTPLRSGESVILMESVRIPPYIDSASAGITFHIRIAAEVFPLISDMEKISLSDKNVQSHITMREFEYDPSELRAFTNNQTVVPGQRISKIVQIHVYDERAPVVDQTDPLPRQDPIEDKTVTGSDETTEINPGKDPVPYIDVTVSTNTPVAVTGNTIFNNNGNQTMNGSTKNISDNSIKQLPAETPTESRSLSLYGTTGSTSSIFSSGKAVGGRIREFLTGDDSVMVMWLSIAMAALLLLILYAVNINTVRAMCVPTANSIMSPFEIASNSMPTLPVRTAAFLSDQDQKINRFSPGEIRTDVTEQYDPPELSTGINVFRKAVRIRNTGNAPCYVRVFLSVSDNQPQSGRKYSPSIYLTKNMYVKYIKTISSSN